jgi:hypothetical protein
MLQYHYEEFKKKITKGFIVWLSLDRYGICLVHPTLGVHHCIIVVGSENTMINDGS